MPDSENRARNNDHLKFAGIFNIQLRVTGPRYGRVKRTIEPRYGCVKRSIELRMRRAFMRPHAVQLRVLRDHTAVRSRATEG